MIRVVIENIVLLLLPTVLYFSYIYLTRGTVTNRQQAIDDAPFLWLFVAGAALCMIALAFFASYSGAGRPQDVYIPSVVKDGKIIPGRIERRPAGAEKPSGNAEVVAPPEPSAK